MYSDEVEGPGQEEGMNDAQRFQRIMMAHGGKAGEPSRKLFTFLRDKGVTEPAIEYLTGYVLKKSGGVRAIDFYSEAGWLGANAAGFVPIAIRDGLLIVGDCPNGDLVAVDVRDQLGAAGYISHEAMWQATNVREVFKVLASGLGALAAGLDEGAIPQDYYEAKSEG
jgi:hypothetical protein